MTIGIIDGVPTNAYKLWHNLYPVKLQNKNINDKRYRLYQGTLSEDEEINAMQRSETTTVYRTPIAMVMLYDIGKIPYITSNSDLYEIYTMLVKHLNNWATAIRNPVSGLTPPPAQDLLAIEQFTEYLYDSAMFVRETLKAKDNIATYDSSLAAFMEIFGIRQGGRATTQASSGKKVEMVTAIGGEIIPTFSNSIGDAWTSSGWGEQ